MATWIWSGVGAGSWFSSANWQGGVLPNSQTAAIISSGDASIFTSNAFASQVSLSGNRRLFVEAGLPGQGNLTVGGQISVAAGSDLIIRNEGEVNAIELLIAGRLVIGQNTAGAAQFRSGNFAGVVNLTSTGSVYFNHLGSSTNSQVITGSGSVEVAGGLVTLGGDNSYSGTTTVNSSLTIESGTALGSTVGGTVVNGTLYMQGGIVVGNEALTLNGNGGLRNTANTNTYGGGITLISDSRINSDAGSLILTNTIDNGGHLLTISGQAQIQIAGSITGSGGLNKTGSGNLVFSGTNTWTGTANIQGGSLTLASNASFAGAVFLSGNADLELSSSATIGSLANSNVLGMEMVDLGTHTLTLGGNNTSTEFTGVITGVGGLTKEGTGTFTLKGNNNDYTGTTTINAGALNIQTGGALGAGNGGTVVAAGAALQLQGGIYVGTEALTLNGTGVGNTGALRNLSGANTYEGAVTLGSASRINSDAGQLTFNNTIATGANLLTLGGNGLIEINGAVTGTAGFTKDGVGDLILAGANSWTGAGNILAGKLTLGNNTAFSGAVILAQDTTLELAASASIGSLDDVGGNNNRFVNLGANTLTVGGDNSSTLFSGLISGTGGLTKTGTGRLTLENDGTYTGATIVNSGELELLSSGFLFAGSTSITIRANATLLTAGTGAFSSQAVIENSGHLNVSGDQAVARLSGPGNVTLNDGSTLSLTNGLSLFDGNISGSGTLQIEASTAVLTRSTEHTGDINVNGGTLGLTGGGAVENSRRIVLSNGGVLDIAAAGGAYVRDILSVNTSSVRMLGSSFDITHAEFPDIGAITFVGSDGAETLRISLAQNATNLSLASASFVDWTAGTDTIVINANGNGNTNSNTITGSDWDDKIFGGIGTDTLYGGDGNDELIGGTQEDQLFGGSGDDKSFGALGDDTLFADAGFDLLDGGDGIDTADFSAATTVVIAHLDTPTQYAQWGSGAGGALELDTLIGIEYLVGGSGDDYLYGTSGDNSLIGGAGNDYIAAGDGIDSILGEAGRDFIDASYGDDIVLGGDEVGPGDIIYGGAGNDNLQGQGGDDFLYGGHGADMLLGGDGTDVLFVDNADIFGGSVIGGSGIDYIVWQDVANAANLDLSRYSADYFYGYNGDDVVTSFDILNRPEIHGGNGNDTLSGSEAIGSILLGEGDNDRLVSGFGIDHMVGGAGADTFAFSGSGGVDYVYDFKTGGADKLDFRALAVAGIHSLSNLTVITDYSDSGWYGYRYNAVTFDTVWVNTNGVGATQPVASDFLFA